MGIHDFVIYWNVTVKLGREASFDMCKVEGNLVITKNEGLRVQGKMDYFVSYTCQQHPPPRVEIL